ncbi:unnamed protein product [Camellia sinensis]
MAKGGKLTKLKSAAAPPTAAPSSPPPRAQPTLPPTMTTPPLSKALHPVYVGKSRRRYLVGSDVVDNPVFQELVERSGDNDGFMFLSLSAPGLSLFSVDHHRRP